MNILTGITPNANLHIGNYFGAVLPMVTTYNKLKTSDKIFYFAPDLHVLSSTTDNKNLYQQTLDNIKILIASGIDPENSNVLFYRQSQIVGHTDLAWILSCFTGFGEASRMTQFKDKSQKSENENKKLNVGLFTYPILMAADILLYDASIIPLGIDQKQHLELTRDLAIRINNKFNEKIFEVPKVWSEQISFFQKEEFKGVEGLKIRSLTHPDKKMSKSDFDFKGTIFLSDSPEDAYKKIMSAETDSFGMIGYDFTNQPGVSNLIQILSLVRNVPLTLIINEFVGNKQYGELKKVVATEISEFLRNFQKAYSSITNQEVEDVLEKHEKIIQILATKKLKKIKKVLGYYNNVKID
jgi:tryptophanyl-tRNA synthetase